MLCIRKWVLENHRNNLNTRKRKRNVETNRNAEFCFKWDEQDLNVDYKTIYFTELGSSFANHLSKSLDVHGGVWPEVSGMSPTNERKRTFSLTNSIANSFGGGSGSGSGAPPTEKECRQVFFDCALWVTCAGEEWVTPWLYPGRK